MFTICNNLLGRNQDLPLPPGFMNEELAEYFNNFFISKINKIRDNLTANQVQLLQLPASHENAVPCMNTFRMLSEEDVSIMVRKSPEKSCKADPIPTALLKEILPDIIPLLRAVVNKSPQSGTFLDDVKVALVRP